MAEFTTTVEEIDAATLEQETNEALEARFEGWSPARSGLFTWMNQAFSRIGAMLYGQLGLTLAAMFKRFGESLVVVPPIQAAPASAESTWKVVAASEVPRTIPAGTQVTILGAEEQPQGFRTVEDVTVPAEATSVTVTLVAIEPGSERNGLSADPLLRDALSWIDTIELDAPTAGGVDEEDEDTYLNRLVESFQTLSLSLIVGRDFEIDARGMAPVHRAKAIEAWDASKGEAAALHATTVAVDVEGQDLSTANEEALQERQQEKVPSGVIVHAAKPTRTSISVKAVVAVKAGFDPATTLAAVESRLLEYLDPANWGLPDFGDPGTVAGWVNKLKVRHLELVSEVDRVGGVDYVASLELAKGEGALGTADLELPGPVALTEPGTIEVSAV